MAYNTRVSRPFPGNR